MGVFSENNQNVIKNCHQQPIKTQGPINHTTLTKIEATTHSHPLILTSEYIDDSNAFTPYHILSLNIQELIKVTVITLIADKTGKY